MNDSQTQFLRNQTIPEFLDKAEQIAKIIKMPIFKILLSKVIQEAKGRN